MAKIDTYLPTIRAAISAVRAAHATAGRYDSHDVVEWLSLHHPTELDDIVAEYGGADPVMTATQQLGKAIEKCGEVKIDTRVSDRRLTVGGVVRDGRCEVAVWRI